jgi:hypothetical protein
MKGRAHVPAFLDGVPGVFDGSETRVRIAGQQKRIRRHRVCGEDECSSPVKPELARRHVSWMNDSSSLAPIFRMRRGTTGTEMIYFFSDSGASVSTCDSARKM